MIQVVSVDGSDEGKGFIRSGEMVASAAQQPELIGSTAVENAVNLINGVSIPSSIPVEVTLITK